MKNTSSINQGGKFSTTGNKSTVFRPMPQAPLRKLPGVKSYPQGQQPPDNYLPLEKVIGLSSRGSTSIAVNPVTGDLAYPAGAIICIYNPKENKQTKFLYSQIQQRSYSCLAFSQNGKYLAAGEGAFRQPEITIWEINENDEYVEIKHLRGHKYGIESVMFSPNMLYLISLGDTNDRGLFVWDWRQEQRVTSNKLGKPVNTFTFAASSQFFVTAGYQHLKYWQFDEDGRVQKNGAMQGQESIMESKSADLTKVKLKIFIGVQCISNAGLSGKEEQVLALAVDGHLYVYDRNRKLTKWMNIKVERAMSCALSGQMLYCACAEGFVRIFNTKSLEHIITLPKPPPLGKANVESGKKIHIPSSKDSRFADALAVLVDDKNQRVVVLYSDRMIFIWDVKQMERISVYRTLYSHSGPIYDLQYIPNSNQIGYTDGNNESTLESPDSVTKFATCSSDRTVRFWNFLDTTTNQQALSKQIVRNAYSMDMSRMIYINSDVQSTDLEQQKPFEQFKAKILTLNEDGTPKQNDSAVDKAQDQQQARDLEQLRCIRISPDGKHLACGDWSGNIRIHDISRVNPSTGQYEEIQCIQAHDGEVLCLDYSPSVVNDRFWLASGSRDRLTHIYETNGSQQYHNVAILDEHSSTITSVKFTEERNDTNTKKRLKLISSGADKQIVIRNVDTENPQNLCEVQRKEQCKHKVFSMDSAGGYGVTGHDKYLQLWSFQGTQDKQIWERRAESTKKAAVLDHLRVYFGPSDNSTVSNDIIITSCADKQVTIYETLTGNAICRTTCGEVTTAMCLSTNLKHMITASMDGIIYIWKLPEQLTKAMLKLRNEPVNIVKQPKTNNVMQVLDQDVDDDPFIELLESNQEINERQKSHFKEESEDEQSKEPDESMSQQPPPNISQIMQQINKVADQIDKIQPVASRGRLFSGTSESPIKNVGLVDFETIPLQLPEAALPTGRKRNMWGAAKQSENHVQEDNNSIEEVESPTHNVRAMHIKDNKLPRWAQSVTGDPTLSNNQVVTNKIQESIEEVGNDEDIEDVFSNTLEKVIAKEDVIRQGLFYGHINKDESDGQEDEDDRYKMNDDEDEEIIQQRSSLSNEKRLFNRRVSENRQSQSQLYFQQKKLMKNDSPDTSNEEENKEQIEVEDIFDESTIVVPEKIIQNVDIEQPKEEIQEDIIEDNIEEEENVVVEDEKAQDVRESIQSESMVQIIDQPPSQEDILAKEFENLQQTISRINSIIKNGKKDNLTACILKTQELWNETLTLTNHNVDQSSMNFNPPTQSSGFYVQNNTNQSFATSQISIKEDARDLLERYSDILLQEVIRKLNK